MTWWGLEQRGRIRVWVGWVAVGALALACAGCDGETADGGESAAPTASAPGETTSTVQRYEDVDWEEVTTAIVTCMHEKGWPVEHAGPTEIGFSDIPRAQKQQSEEDYDVCRDSLTLPPAEPPSEEWISRFYDHLVETEQFLEEMGYDIADPPTFDVYIDDYATGPWHPYNSLPSTLSIQELDEVEEQCPQS